MCVYMCMYVRMYICICVYEGFNLRRQATFILRNNLGCLVVSFPKT